MNGFMALSSPGWVLVVGKGLCLKKPPARLARVGG
jgi:hypothetical protein